MRIRAAVGAVVVAVTALTTSASAAPSCNIIVDAEGDASVIATPSDPSVDLVSGDVASDKNLLTAVLRVKKLTVPNVQAPFGQAYFLVFNVKGSPDPLFVSAGLYPTGNEFAYGYQGADPNSGINTSYTLGEAIGTVDMDKSELRISVPIASFAGRGNLKPGGKLSGLVGEARKLYGQRVVKSQSIGPSPRIPFGGFTLTFDTAEGKSYDLGTPSCVAVGK